MKIGPTPTGQVDILTGENGISRENTLQSAVIISLLTDRRANPDDDLDDNVNPLSSIPPDRRGWCGDALGEAINDRIGSRLWLLRRKKKTEETRKKAIFYAQEALQWLLDDGVAISIDITASWNETALTNGWLDLIIVIMPATGEMQTYNIGVNSGGYYVV